MEQQELEQHSDVSLDYDIVLVEHLLNAIQCDMRGEPAEYRPDSCDVVVGREDVPFSTLVPVADVEGSHMPVA